MNSARDCARRALAVRELAERYGQPSDRRLAAVVSDHLESMGQSLTALTRELAFLGQASDDPPAAPQSWSDAANQAFVNATALESEVLALFTATTMEVGDAATTSSKCVRSQRNLEAALCASFARLKQEKE